MKFEKIEFKTKHFVDPASKCPECDGDLYYGMIPCPEGRPGCLVAHYGYTCDHCHSIFKFVPDEEGEEIDMS